MDVFAQYPWLFPQSILGWWGFWGLKTTVYGNFAMKPSLYWYGNEYSAHFPNCTGSNWSTFARTPYVTLTAANDYFTLGQPVRVTWTAFDADLLSLSRVQSGSGMSLDCQPNAQGAQQNVGAGVVGSCAYTEVQPFSTTGNQSLMVSATKISQAGPVDHSLGRHPPTSTLEASRL